jgi:phosphocarrier protein HPr
MTASDEKKPHVQKRKMVVQNEVGLHARPAKNLVSLLSRFSSDVFIEKDGYRINAKSIIGVLTLAAVHGTVLMVIAEGADAAEALDALEQLFAEGFGED